MGKPDNIEEIFKRYLDDEHSLQDLQVIQSYFNTHERGDLLSALVEKELADSNDQEYLNMDAIDRILSNTDDAVFLEINKNVKTNRWFIHRSVFRAIAALLLIGVTVGASLYMGSASQPEKKYSNATEILPGTNKAVLNLADGRRIELGGDEKEIIINTDAIAYKDGSSVVVISDQLVDEAALNTITTPKGGQYQIILADGTKVWLNANSSLKYPSKFLEERRVVELVGEAFFEVNSKPTEFGANIPFIVKTSKQEVFVTGTKFNVSAYDDELVTTTTLVEGVVRVSSSRNEATSSAILKPGQQSVVSTGGLAVTSPEIENAVAWKNGKFVFSNQSFETTMRQIARWYDVEFELVDKDLFNLKLGGTVSRSNKLSTVLEAMSATEKVAFQFKENKIYIKSVNLITKP